MRIDVSSHEREEMIEISAQVAEVVEKSGLESGAVLVYVPHTTAAVTINENADPDVARDLLDGLRRAAPCDAGWLHCEGNSDAHLKTSLVGSSVTVPVESGRMLLGTWQGVWFCEFDGPRNRSVVVTVLAAAE